MKEKPTIHDYEWNNLLIPPDIGVGYKWKNDQGEDYRTELPDCYTLNGKRIVELYESNCLGSLGAQHYYADLKASHVFNLTNDNCIHMGYVGKEAPHDFIEPLRIKVTRTLTKLEKDLDGRPIGRVGEETYRFNLPEEARAAGIKLFKKRFAPGWILVIEDMCGEKEILAET